MLIYTIIGLISHYYGYDFSPKAWNRGFSGRKSRLLLPGKSGCFRAPNRCFRGKISGFSKNAILHILSLTMVKYRGFHKIYRNYAIFMNFYRKPVGLISCSKNSQKNAKNGHLWGIGGIFKKTLKNSSIHRGILHDLRPVDLDGAGFYEIWARFHAIWWKIVGWYDGLQNR